MFLPVRKHPRLKNYDYSQCGCYHLVLCSKNRQPIFSYIIPASDATERARISLLHTGSVVEQYIQNIPLVYSGVHLLHHVTMPNHVHLLLLLDTEATASVSTIVRSLKRMVTKEIGTSVWQKSFYDVVIRNESMFQCEWEYIDQNPDKWLEDNLYVVST